MSYCWSDDHRRKVREYAVSDVLDGMSLIGAAVLWNVQLSELKQLVDDARVNGRGES